MIDTTVFLTINSLAGNYALLDYFFIFITHFGILIILALVLFTKDKKLILQAAFAFLLAVMIDQLINFLFFRPRPFVLGLGTLLISKSGLTSSFPSGHTLMSFAPAAVLFFKNHELGKYALLVASLVGLSRIYVGVHYPSDVLAGMIFGLMCAFIVKKGFERISFR
ncbi:phosphatase PAP2 family protein [archaeon]|nr:phosphatase PAP2 family protein [archaeon]